jgi:phenylacetate-CoA ligase
VNVFPSQIEEQILRDKRLCGNYQIHLSRSNHLDEVAIHCELQSHLSTQISPDERSAIGRQLQHQIKTVIGISTEVQVMGFDSLPRTLVGKARRVFDQRPQQI